MIHRAVVKGLSTSLNERTLRHVELIARRAALAAGAVLRRLFDRVEVRVKAARLSADYRIDVVTRADVAAERAILAVLRRCRVRASVVSEERSALRRPGPFTWVIDPLDGTANFVSGVPYFAVSIALLEHGHPIVGVVLDPLRRDLFTAVRGDGIRVNGALPARPRRRPAPLVLFGLGRHRVVAEASLKTAGALLPTGVFGLRMLGSAALDLAAVATGMADVFYHRSMRAWDIAAGVLLVQEAGGRVRLASDEGQQTGAIAPPVRLSSQYFGPVLAYRGKLTTKSMKPLLAVLRR
jgi:myo-inositol-1(or 4)-monophosphatase